ncbi:hypothetical protein ACFVFD_13155 [Streptomyces fimicarius]|uniref:hypothetical protein n=1 Tax=Streptomyces griseus TaxID=1911 RepID=UPI0036823651
MRIRAEESGSGSIVACAAAADVHENSVRQWCGGLAAPRRVNSEAVERLVVFLRREAGQPAVFDDHWRRALEAAQQEADDARGASRERQERGLFMEAIGARQFLERPLDGRAAELRLIDGFLRTTDDAASCLWLQAGPGAGKSALLGRAAQHLWSSPKFDVVGYFVSAADGWDRAGHFTGVMVRQLTGLLGRKRPPARPEEVPPTKLRALFRSAAVHSAGNGRRLVVVVDGLDQDARWRGGVPESERPWTSIASLLPWPDARAEKESGRKRHGRRSVRVIVSSRPAAVPPADVPADHPLRRAESVRLLGPSPRAKNDGDSLRDGLDRLRGSASGRAVVGFLATAGAGLCADDLAELTGGEPAGIAGMLEAFWGRCLVPDDLGAGSYVLADDELLRSAREKNGPDLRAECVRRLHAWADSWHTGERSGPLPRYLLSHYPAQLCEGPRLERYVLDPRRQLRLVEAGRLDEALAQLDLLPDEADRTPEVAARVALSRAVLSGRTRPPVPRELPLLFALAGDVTRARQLAVSASEDAVKAARLAEVVSVVSGSDPAQAAQLASEAVGWAERAAEATPRIAEQNDGMEELAEAGHSLVECGAEEAGRAVLRAVVPCEAVGWPSRIKAAQALGPEREDWLAEVARYASVLAEGGVDEQAEALEIWGQMIVRNAPGAVALRDTVKDFCAELDPASDLAHADLVALGASALARDRRNQAREMVGGAVAALTAAFTAPEALSPADRAHLDLELSTTLVRVVQALHDVDYSAKKLLDAVPAELCKDTLDEDVQEQARSVKGRSTDSSPKGPARAAGSTELPGGAHFLGIREELAGNPVRGRHLLADAFARWEHSSAATDHGWQLPLAQALATAGHAREAVRLAGLSPDPGERAGALAVVAAGCAAGGRGAEALRYAQEAARAAVDLADPAVRGLVAQAFAHAGASESALSWAAGGGPSGREREQVERSQAAVAVGLAPYDPETAARIVGQQLLEVRRAALVPGGERHLPRIMGLLLALPDPRRPGNALCAALQELCAGPAGNIQGRDMHAVLFHALLDVSGCRSGVVPLGGRFGRWERYMGSTPLPEGVLPVAEWAVLHAVRGDVRAARDTAGRARTPERRVAALTAVATYLAGVPVIVPAADGWAPQDTSVLRFLALADAFGNEATRDEHEARRLVREVLAGEHWRYALPLLPRLAPEALPRLAEVAFVHGGNA